jgi:predicted branched-subunit amino acid permease
VTASSSFISGPRYETAADALRGGALEGMGAPALVLGSGYIGFGALAADAGVSLPLAVLSTPMIFALPAQIIMVEMWQLGTPVLALVLAVMMANARFLPMTATLLPQMRHPRWNGWHYAFATHLVAMSGWAIAMRRNVELEAEHRLPFFCGFSLIMWLGCSLGTLIGFFLSGGFHDLVTVGLIFLNPIYFILILTRETRTRLGITALLCGAVAGPLVHLWIPDWSLIVGGILAGLLAFAILESTGAARRG